MGPDRNSPWYPKARSEGLVVEPAGDELMVYDLDSHKVHCLNRLAAGIWQLCDGNHTIEGISESLASDAAPELREQLVRAGVGELRALKLLENDETASVERLSRRELVKKLGIGAIAAAITIPIVTTIVAPPAYAAISCKKQGACASPRECCSNICIANQCVPV